MTALVTHVCSGSETEVDISLDVLRDLVTLHTALLMRYATFLKVGVLLGVYCTHVPQVQSRLVLFRYRVLEQLVLVKLSMLRKKCSGQK